MAKKFTTDNHGSTALEYGLIAGLISVVIIGSLIQTGTSVFDLYMMVVDALPS